MIIDNKTLETFVKGMYDASQLIQKENPSYILAPLRGAEPLIDILNIVDPRFDLNKVFYMPGSSALYGVRKLIRDWFKGFLGEYGNEAKKVLTVDEVVSGNSAVRLYKQINTILEDNTNINLEYKSLGIQDNKLEKKNKSRNKEYLNLVKSGKVIPVDVGQIITMDRSEFSPVKFKTKTQDNKLIYLPEIEKFEITPEYLNLLESIARVVGVNPEEVNPVGLTKIKEFNRFLSKEDSKSQLSLEYN